MNPTFGVAAKRARDLSQAQIHVAHFPLDAAPGPHRSLLRLLDHDERSRSCRIASAAARARFEVAHALTRIVLGHYLDVPPQSIAFTRRPGGKPAIAGATELRFSLSHSGAHAVLAVALGREIGIDVEQLRTIDVEGLARRFLTAAEADTLAAVAGDCRLRSFFRCWTRKESLAKAKGVGLALGLDGLDLHGHPAWTIVDLDTIPGYVASLTFEGAGCRVIHTDAPSV